MSTFFRATTRSASTSERCRREPSWSVSMTDPWSVRRQRVRPRRRRRRPADNRPPPATGLGAAGAARLRRSSMAAAVRAAVAGAGVSARRRGRHRHRLHRVHRAADDGRRHAVVRAGRVRRPAPCVREAVEAPRRAVARRPAQRVWRTNAASRGSGATAGALVASGSWPRRLQLLEEDPEIYARMDRWVEAADWIVWQLCGEYLRNACATGFQGGLAGRPVSVARLLRRAEPRVRALHRARRSTSRSAGSATRAGGLTAAMAERLGLPAGIAVCVGNVDAHVTAPAAGAVGPGQLVAIMGTSTCHVMNGAELRDVEGICGVVDGGIVAGLVGYEAGQSGVGDIFGWFVDHGVPPDVTTRPPRSGVVRARAPHATLARRPAGRRARAGRARLAQRQPVGAGRPRTVRADRRPDPGHPTGGHLPRA